MATPLTVDNFIDMSRPLTTVVPVPGIKLSGITYDISLASGGGGGGSTRPTTGMLYPRYN